MPKADKKKAPVIGREAGETGKAIDETARTRPGTAVPMQGQVAERCGSAPRPPAQSAPGSSASTGSTLRDDDHPTRCSARGVFE